MFKKNLFKLKFECVTYKYLLVNSKSLLKEIITVEKDLFCNFNEFWKLFELIQGLKVLLIM